MYFIRFSISISIGAPDYQKFIIVFLDLICRDELLIKYIYHALACCRF